MAPAASSCPLPPLHDYIQFRFDFEGGDARAIRLDYLAFDYASPVVSRGILAENFPDTAAVLGQPAQFRNVLRPDVDRAETGFDRIDIAVPTPDAQIDTLLVDDLGWTRVLPAADAEASRTASTAAPGWIRCRSPGRPTPRRLCTTPRGRPTSSRSRPAC